MTTIKVMRITKETSDNFTKNKTEIISELTRDYGYRVFTAREGDPLTLYVEGNFESHIPRSVNIVLAKYKAESEVVATLDEMSMQYLLSRTMSRIR